MSDPQPPTFDLLCFGLGLCGFTDSQFQFALWNMFEKLDSQQNKEIEGRMNVRGGDQLNWLLFVASVKLYR